MERSGLPLKAPGAAGQLDPFAPINPLNSAVRRARDTCASSSQRRTRCTDERDHVDKWCQKAPLKSGTEKRCPLEGNVPLVQETPHFSSQVPGRVWFGILCFLFLRVFGASLPCQAQVYLSSRKFRTCCQAAESGLNPPIW